MVLSSLPAPTAEIIDVELEEKVSEDDKIVNPGPLLWLFIRESPFPDLVVSLNSPSVPAVRPLSTLRRVRERTILDEEIPPPVGCQTHVGPAV